MHVATDLVSGACRVVTLPAVYLRVRALLADRAVSRQALAAAVASDPALCARLLRLVNSAFFGAPSRIETVSHAIALLGHTQLHDFVLATSVAAAFPRVAPALIDLDRYWRESLRMAVAVRGLGTACGVGADERLFVTGLLAGIGHLVMLLQLPEAMAAALREAQRAGIVLAEVERRRIGCDHAEVGGLLLRQWNVPDSIARAVRWQLEPDAAGEFASVAAVVHLAQCLLPPFGTAPAIPGEGSWTLTGLAESRVEPLLREIESEFALHVGTLLPALRDAA